MSALPQGFHLRLIHTNQDHGLGTLTAWPEVFPLLATCLRRDNELITTNEFDEVAAGQAIAGLHLRMNAWNERVKVRQMTLSELVDHYRQRELTPDILWKTLDKSDMRRLSK